MRSLTTTELLTVWERGLNQTMLQRMLELLSLAYPEAEAGDLAKLSVGERDNRLLLLRKRLFGPHLINVADCPQCSERIEWETNIDDIRLRAPRDHHTTEVLTLEVDDFSVRFRLPNSVDISTVIANGEERSGPEKLLASCILDTRCAGNSCGIDDLPERVKHALIDRMEEEDPQADVSMILNCPNCSHQWELQFDIALYFWDEINAWAERTFRAVHRLATAYGWFEHDILTMSPVRRQIYLELAKS